MGLFKKLKGKKWFQQVLAVAPTIGTALGGPFAGLALQTLGKALGVDPTEVAIEDALANNPEALLKLKDSERDFELEMEKLGLTEQQLYLDDRKDARAREIAVKDKMPAVMAVFGITLWLFILVVLFFQPDITIVQPEQRDILMYVLATTQTIALAGVYYYLGSSRGSKDKTVMLERYLNGK